MNVTPHPGPLPIGWGEGERPMPWRALELTRGRSAVAVVWRRHLGEQAEAFQRAFLLASPEPAKSFPCDQCGCAHEVIPRWPLTELSSGAGRDAFHRVPESSGGKWDAVERVPTA